MRVSVLVQSSSNPGMAKVFDVCLVLTQEIRSRTVLTLIGGIIMVMTDWGLHKRVPTIYIKNMCMCNYSCNHTHCEYMRESERLTPMWLSVYPVR